MLKFMRLCSIFNNLTALSLFITIIGMPFGQKLFGRFAISNVFQIIGVILIIPNIITRKCRLSFLLWNLYFVFSLLLSNLLMLAIYDIYTLQLAHILFFSVIMIYVGYFHEYFKTKVLYRKKIIETVYAMTVMPALIYFAFLGVQSVLLRHWLTAFGFDDKSHAVLCLSFYAFLSLKFIRGWTGVLLSAIFMLGSMRTVSRFVVFFLPFYAFAVYVTLRRNKISKTILVILFALFASLFVIFVVQNIQYFGIFSRLSSNNKAAQGSTSEHLELIKTALTLKISSFANLICGIGPGNYGNVLIASGIETPLLKKGYSNFIFILGGWLPVHSSHAQIFLDFSLPVFTAYCWLFYTIWNGNRKNKNIIEICFLIPFAISTVFYSTHNEVLYWVILIYLFAESRSNKCDEKSMLQLKNSRYNTNRE